jgi:hypothetical protein
MKAIVLSFVSITLNIAAHSQTKTILDFKIDSLSVELSMLEQEKKAIESQINVINLQIEKLSHQKMIEFGDSTIKAKCVYFSGCYLTDAPNSRSNIVKKVLYGESVRIDARYFVNKYFKASAAGEVGYLYYEVVERNPDVLVLLKAYSSKAQPLTPSTSVSQQGNDYSAPSTGGYHSIQTGPRGGKYYINSNGKKTYVKKH